MFLFISVLFYAKIYIKMLVTTCLCKNLIKRDLKTEHVWYSNGQLLFGCWIVQFSNVIWIPNQFCSILRWFLQPHSHMTIQNLNIFCSAFIWFFCGLLKWGGIFSTTFYGLYFSHHTLHTLQFRLVQLVNRPTLWWYSKSNKLNFLFKSEIN